MERKIVAPMQRTDSYRDLIAWQKAMVLARSIYEITASWPADHRFELTSQLRRAAVSIPSNIAEGSGRTGIREFHHGVSVAHGSLCELETQLTLAIELGLCNPERGYAMLHQAAEVGRIIRSLLNSLEQRKTRAKE